MHWITPDDLDMGYLLFALFIGLSVRALKQPCRVNVRPIYVLPLFLISGLLFLSEVLDLKTVFFVAAPLGFLMLNGFALGHTVLKRILLPTAVLMMAMPFWYLLVPYLQKATVIANTQWIEATGITALIEGSFITVPTGIIHIAGGCSGLKYFMTAMSLAFIAAAWNRVPFRYAVISAVIAVALAILANWIRVGILVYVGYTEGVSHPWMAEHDMLGWIVFAVAMIPWFLVEARLNKHETSVSESTDMQAELTTAWTTASVKTGLAAVIGLILLFTPHAILKGTGSTVDQVQAISAPQIKGLTPLSDQSRRTWFPAYAHPDQQLHRRFLWEGKVLDLSILRFTGNGEGELAKTTNQIFPENWRQLSDRTWQSSDGKTRLRIAIGARGKEYRVVYYWYDHSSGMKNSITGSKLALLIDSLAGDRSGDLIALSVSCTGECMTMDEPSPAVLTLIKALAK